MLEELHVKDLALIEEAWLEFEGGMTVLTGETGAGKTVLLGALKLLLGERADATLVRSGAPEAVVEGRFRTGEDERTARRRLSADGRSRCYLDGEMATVGALADELGPLVDLHGQHDHQELLRAASHAELFDRFAGVGEALTAYRAAYRAHAEAASELERLTDAMGDRERRAAALRVLVDEIDRVDPQLGEDETIAAALPRLQHGEKLAAASSAAYRALEGEEGASDRLSAALLELRRVSGIDAELDIISQEAEAIGERLGTVSARLRDYGEAVDRDPVALDASEARLAALSVAKRSYGPTLEDVIAARDAASAELETLDAGEAGLDRVRVRVDAADDALRAAAAAVRDARIAAAPAFERMLAAASHDLAMPGAHFTVALEELSRDAWTLGGPQHVEFLYSPAQAEPVRPLVRIASGGEVSRVMLALKSVLGAADTVPVLVFDEIDAGIGGATALAVGRRLKELAVGRQVLVVTHLAQVAAFADAHLVVEKAEVDGRARTCVRAVSDEDRIAEIARMLSGSDTGTSRAHARELLETWGAPHV